MTNSLERNETYITYICTSLLALEPDQDFYYRAGQMLRDIERHYDDVDFFMDDNAPEDCWLPDARMLKGHIKNFLQDIDSEIAECLREFSLIGTQQAVKTVYEAYQAQQSEYTKLDV